MPEGLTAQLCGGWHRPTREKRRFTDRCAVNEPTADCVRMARYETERHCGGAGSPSSDCRGTPIEGEKYRGGRGGRWCFRDERQTLEKSVAGGRHGGTRSQATSWPKAKNEFLAAESTLSAVARWTPPGRIRHGVVDLCTGSTSHQARVRYRIQCRPCRSSPATPWLDPTETRASRTRTRRGCHSPLAPARLAANKKGARAKGASVVFLDESGFMLQPVNRRTWAPRGETPFQYVWHRHDRLSVIGAVTLAPTRNRCGIYFKVQDRNVRAPDITSFLKELHQQLRRPLILVLDRWSAHRSATNALSCANWLTVEWLPAYAPDLNPVEAMWSHTKYCDLANFVPEDSQHLEDSVVESLCEQVYETNLKKSFFQTAGLDLK
jgi:transposase